MAGRLAGRQNMAGLQNPENALQVNFYFVYSMCNVINSFRSAFQSAFLKQHVV